MASTTLTYGDVLLSVVNTNYIQRVPVRSPDGAGHVCTMWTFDVDCVYNPGDVGMSYTNPAGIPVITVGELPPTTDLAIREYLMTDRRPLVYTNEGIEVLRSPNANLVCDAANGPKVESVTVTKVLGGKTWLIHFRVSTWVNGCDDATNPLKAHRWRIVVDIDTEQMSTRTIIGEAIFDVGMLATAGTFADQYRGSFFHPVPPSFFRARVHVDVSDDGTTVSYQIVDQERNRNYGTTCPATRIEAMESGSVISTGFFSGTQATRLVAAVSNAATAFATKSPSASHKAGAAAGGFLSGIVPRITRSINVRAYGPKSSTREAILDLCLGIAFGRLGSPSILSPAMALTMTQDPLGNYAEVTYDVQVSAVGLGIVGLFGTAASVVMLREYLRTAGILANGYPSSTIFADTVPLLDIRGNPYTLPDFTTSSSTTNRPFQGQNQSRGTWMGALVTQLLLYGNCDTPPAPPPPTNNVQLS